MASRVNWSAILPWVWRLLIAIAILASPIITFWAFTDRETSDPDREQRLRNASQYQNHRPPDRSDDSQP